MMARNWFLALPWRSVVMSPRYWAAPNRAPACWSRKIVYDRSGASARARTLSTSKPSCSVVEMSVTFTEACGMHAASWAFDAVRRSSVIAGACEARACEGLWLAAPALPVTMPAIAAVQAAAERMVRRDIDDLQVGGYAPGDAQASWLIPGRVSNEVRRTGDRLPGENRLRGERQECRA